MCPIIFMEVLYELASYVSGNDVGADNRRDLNVFPVCGQRCRCKSPAPNSS